MKDTMNTRVVKCLGRWYWSQRVYCKTRGESWGTGGCALGEMRFDGNREGGRGREDEGGGDAATGPHSVRMRRYSRRPASGRRYRRLVGRCWFGVPLVARELEVHLLFPGR